MPQDAREELTRKTRTQFPEINLPEYNFDVCIHDIFRAAENGDYDLVERVLRLDRSASRRTRPEFVYKCMQVHSETQYFYAQKLQRIQIVLVIYSNLLIL